MRKSFTISKTVKEAYAYICGVGQFELSLNGEKVGDHQLDPAWSDYKKECYYVTFDVTSQLKSGENAVGVYLADGFMDLGNNQDRYQYFSHSDGAKRMIMELHIKNTVHPTSLYLDS